MTIVFPQVAHGRAIRFVETGQARACSVSARAETYLTPCDDAHCARFLRALRLPDDHVSKSISSRTNPSAGLGLLLSRLVLCHPLHQGQEMFSRPCGRRT